MGWTNDQLESLTLPGNGIPGDARIFIGANLPEPLASYTLAEPEAGGYAAAVIFYGNSPGDNDDTNYTFLAVVDNGAGLYVMAHMGHVRAGAVVERVPGEPMGQFWSLNFASLTNAIMYLYGQGLQLQSVLQPIELRALAAGIKLSAAAGNAIELHNNGTPSLLVTPTLIDARRTISGNQGMTITGGTTTIDGDLVSQRSDCKNGFATAPGVFNLSGVYGDYPGPTAASITKRYTATRLRVRWAPTFFVDNLDVGVQCAVRIGSNDHLTSVISPSIDIFRRFQAFGERFIVGIAAGPVTVIGRIGRHEGTGGVFVTELDDYFSLSVEEVPA